MIPEHTEFFIKGGDGLRFPRDYARRLFKVGELIHDEYIASMDIRDFWRAVNDGSLGLREKGGAA